MLFSCPLQLDNGGVTTGGSTTGGCGEGQYTLHTSRHKATNHSSSDKPDKKAKVPLEGNTYFTLWGRGTYDTVYLHDEPFHYWDGLWGNGGGVLMPNPYFPPLFPTPLNKHASTEHYIFPFSFA